MQALCPPPSVTVAGIPDPPVSSRFEAPPRGTERTSRNRAGPTFLTIIVGMPRDRRKT